MSEDMKVTELLPLVTEVVSAQLANSKTASSDVGSLIQSVYKALDELRTNGTPAELPKPAVPVEKSITPEYIVCLEDGKQLKMLKRYLRNTHGMTPEEYRKRWGLPADYPMVAPKYAEKRSKIAKSLGLGTAPRRKRAKKKV
jgi:predicted transcriptional regulator